MADVVMQERQDGNKNSDCSTEGGEDKIENVSGSVSDGDNNPNGSIDSNNQLPKRKKKTRRGKNKKRKYKPYNKLSWQERRELEDRETQRANRTRAEMFAHGQPVAPYNTTQFLMDDHNDVQDLDLQLKSVLVGDIKTQVPPVVTHRNSRMRDSSFSLDSEEDFFYSSPEDEEEFLTKEFSNTYEVVHTERLNTMSKTELIHELMKIEEKAEQLDKRLAEYKAKERGEELKIDSSTDKSDLSNSRRIVGYEEMKKVLEENADLRRENERLMWNLGKCRCRSNRQAKVSSSSSVDSDSDSTSSVSSSSSSSCSSASGCRLDRKPIEKKRRAGATSVVRKLDRGGGEEVKENGRDLSVPVVNGCASTECEVSKDAPKVQDSRVDGTRAEDGAEEEQRQSPATERTTRPTTRTTSKSGRARSRRIGNVGDVEMDVEMSHNLK